MNQIPNIEETLAKKLHALETDWSDGCYIRGEDVDAICDYVHQQLQKAPVEERERIKALFPKLNPNSDSWGTAEMERILKQIDQSELEQPTA